MIYVSDSAIRQILYLRMRQGKTDCGLRIKVLGGGCNGLAYKLEFESAMENNDNVFDFNIEGQGLTIVIDPKSYLFLKEIRIDYTDGLDGQGFVYDNPNAKSKCGCGTSFS